MQDTPETLEKPTEPNEFIEGANKEIDRTFVDHDPRVISGDISDDDKQKLAEGGVVFHSDAAE